MKYDYIEASQVKYDFQHHRRLNESEAESEGTDPPLVSARGPALTLLCSTDV